ncbi:MAG: hypothetical protein HFH45_03925 [Bacilli bacterium]|nr:hypothetical protein [Bacilli bacterium]
MEKSTDASASIFGWQFQISASIYLMIKYFGRFERLKVESKKEDIEIELENGKKIYAQAKSKQNPLNDSTNHSTKLQKALKTLSNKNKDDAEKLYYVNNLEPDPLNSTRNEFDGLTILDYSELSNESKEKIDAQLSSLKIDDFQKDKFTILRIPYYGNDQDQRQKQIDKKIAQFLISIDYSENYSKNLLDIWQTEFFHNATIPNNEVYIEKNNIIWSLVIIKLKNENKIQEYKKEFGVSEEQFFDAIDKYEKFINYKEGNFQIFNNISHLFEEYSKQNSNKLIFDFINENTDKIFNIIFDKSIDGADIVEITCSKIIARLILLRKSMIKKIIEGANNYGD